MQIYVHFPKLIHMFLFVEGRFAEFGGTIPMRTVQDLAFAVTRFIQKGGSFVNYYMVMTFLRKRKFNIHTAHVHA